MQYKVSVILPSLNVAAYIKECMESVVNQSLRELEIICVDAGSTDGTLEIIEEYAAEDERIKVIKSDRKSYGYQMNLGISAARGEYIGIVETDDFVSLDMYGELYIAAKEKSLDFIKADFYRFTTDGRGKIVKNYYHLTNAEAYKGLYNRVFSPREHLESFYFNMNTWSGIYRREYLLTNNIRHNESPGASFQDNGFWFQTLVFAERAMFIDRPYYMNRRDNPNSSVFSKGKVYAVCSEYEFIRNLLSQDAAVYKCFIRVFWKVCFDTYFFNLQRISAEYALEFTERMARDFRYARERGELDKKIFSGLRWQELLAIAENPVKYHHFVTENKEKLMRELRRHRDVIIYGAGAVGRQMLSLLTYNETPVNVICFAVTKKADNLDEYNGVKICEIQELLEYRQRATVLVAVTEMYREEIENTLSEFGFKSIVSAPLFEQKDERYYEKLRITDYRQAVQEWYWENTGINIDLDNPVTVDDFMQLEKIKPDNIQIRKSLSDRVEFRKIVARKVGEKYLPKLYGIWDGYDEIDFERLPESFELLFTHCYGGAMQVKGRRDYNAANMKKRIEDRLKNNYVFSSGFNLCLSGIEHRVMAVELIDTDLEYNVVCVQGVPRYVYVENHTLPECAVNKRCSVFDADWTLLSGFLRYSELDVNEEKPPFLDEMLEVTAKLTEGINAVSVVFLRAETGLIVREVNFES